jgi:hypothetical protein
MQRASWRGEHGASKSCIGGIGGLKPSGVSGAGKPRTPTANSSTMDGHEMEEVKSPDVLRLPAMGPAPGPHQAGVYQAVAEGGTPLDWVARVSIGREAG